MKAAERLEPMTSAAVVAELQRNYPFPDWLAFPELRIGTGFGKNAEQRLDFWAMAALPSQRFRRVAYEIKISRADFLAELRQPLKRRRALLLSNEFYFVAPPGLIQAGELPPECGLAECEATYGLHIKHAAPWRDSAPPTWQFLAAVTRRALRCSE